MKKKVLSFVFAVMCMCLLGTLSANAITRDDAVNWAKAQIGTAYDVDGLYGYQCSDFGTAYINYIITGNAYSGTYTTYMGYNYFNLSYPSGWQRIENTADFVPELGDILCFGGNSSNSAGHVAVAIEGCTVSVMYGVGQNGIANGGNGEAVKKETLQYYGGWGNFQGVIRPKWNNAVTDTQAPTVSNMRVSNSTDSTFTISADLNDNVGVTRVWLNIYGPNGQNGYAVSASNGTFTHTINMSDYGGLGEYSVHLYAFDAAGNETGAALDNLYFSVDNQAPTINSLKLKEVGKNTFTISADLTDNVGVTRVWLNIYGPNGQNGYAVSASNGTFTHTINTSDYGGFGEYSVHLYAFDNIGNETGAALNNFYIQSNENICIGITQTDNLYNISTKISNLSQSAIYAVAMYSADSKLLDVKTQRLNSGATSANASLSKNGKASYIKVYLWHNLNSIKPIVKCEKITL